MGYQTGHLPSLQSCNQSWQGFFFKTAIDFDLMEKHALDTSVSFYFSTSKTDLASVTATVSARSERDRTPGPAAIIHPCNWYGPANRRQSHCPSQGICALKKLDSFNGVSCL